MNSETFSHAVIIPHYNDLARLERCLSALCAAHDVLPDPNQVEIVVADNNSTEPLEALHAEFPKVRFVTEPRPGAAMARNCGVAATTAQGLIFLDADCVPADGWLAHALSLNAAGAVIGGRIDVFDETPSPRSGAEAFERVFAFKQREYIEQKGFSVTANLVTTRDVFDATGPMITGLSEDVDWCKRAVRSGADLRYDDVLEVSHPTRQDWTALRKKWQRLTHEMFGLNGASRRARFKWAVRGLAMPLSALAHAPKVLTHPELSPVEKWWGVITLIRLRGLRSIWMLRQSLTPKMQKGHP